MDSKLFKMLSLNKKYYIQRKKNFSRISNIIYLIVIILNLINTLFIRVLMIYLVINFGALIVYIWRIGNE